MRNKMKLRLMLFRIKLTGKLKPEKLDGIFTALMFLAGVSMVFA